MDEMLTVQDIVTPELYSFLQKRGLLGKFEDNIKDNSPHFLRKSYYEGKEVEKERIEIPSEAFIFMFANEGMEFWFDVEDAFLKITKN